VRPVRRGDIVVFKYPKDPSRDFIKRCMALPGDTLRSVDKVLYINGKQVHDETFTWHSDPEIVPRRSFFESNRVRDNFGPEVIPEASYFCMGDNRDNSNDSRFWGPVPRGNVKGRAFMIYWSFASDEGEPIEWPGVGGKLRQLGRVGLNFFSKTRWERTFHVVR
jgi:signal peptidase I